jgi:hypothetical protein
LAGGAGWIPHTMVAQGSQAAWGFYDRLSQRLAVRAIPTESQASGVFGPLLVYCRWEWQDPGKTSVQVMPTADVVGAKAA